MITMLQAFMSDPKQGPSRTMWRGVAVLFMTLTTMMVIALLDPVGASGYIYPFFRWVRYISLADFIMNLDVLVMAIWVLGVFIKLSLYLFIASYGTAQLFNLRSRMPTLWFIVPIAFIGALLPRNIYESNVAIFLKIYVPYFVPVTMLAIPIFL